MGKIEEKLLYWKSLEELIEYLNTHSIGVILLIDSLRNSIKEGYNITMVNEPHPGSETNSLVKDMSETFEKCLSLVRKKNNDYSGIKNADTDPFKNIRGAEFVGVPNERGILVRMMDKMGRISSLLSQDAAVKEESINDTLDDLINYAAILKSYIKNNKK